MRQAMLACIVQLTIRSIPVMRMKSMYPARRPVVLACSCMAVVVWGAAGANDPALIGRELGNNQPAHEPPDDSQDRPQTPEDSMTEEAEEHDGAVEMRKLTSEEIHRIRYLELRGMRLTTDRPDRVTVKVPLETVDDFLLEMEGHPDFIGEPARREFRKLTPPQKLHLIARYKGEAYIDKVKIESDPEVFVEFRKRVMPIVARGCATTGCHGPGSGDSAGFSLFDDPKRAKETTYANFVILSELESGNRQMINRPHPQESLLLTCMLPSKEVKPALRHPGDLNIKPVYQSRNAPGYRRIERWIASLKQPTPDYGIRLVPESKSKPTAPDQDPKP